MKKTMTIKQIDNSATMLKNLQGLRKHWPVKVNYAIAKNLKTLLGEVDIGNAVMDGDSYQFPEGKEQEVVKEIDEMYNMETDVDVHMIKMEDISVCDSDSRYDGTTLEDIAAIEFMIED